MAENQAEFFERLPVPRLMDVPIPPKELPETRHLLRLLQDLDRYSSSFKAALLLFDHSRQLQLEAGSKVPAPVEAILADLSNVDLEKVRADIENDLLPSQWSNIAGRDGAMMIYHFGRTLEFVRANIKNCPSINNYIDAAPMRMARRRFDSQFADIEGMRHAIAHASDLWKSLAKRAINIIRGPVKKGTIEISGESGLTIMVNNRQFTMSIEGRLVSYEMGRDTLNALVAIQNEVYSGFRVPAK